MPSRRRSRRLNLSARIRVGTRRGSCVNLSQTGMRWSGESIPDWTREITLELEPGYEVAIQGRVVWSTLENGVSTLGFAFDRPLPTVYGWFKMLEVA